MSIFDTRVNLFVVIFIPFVMLVVALHCFLKKMKVRAEIRRADYLNREEELQRIRERDGDGDSEDGECCDGDKQSYMVCTKRDESIKRKLIMYTQTPTSFSEDENEYEELQLTDEEDESVELFDSELFDYIFTSNEVFKDINLEECQYKFINL